MKEFCSPYHKHDALCDPQLSMPGKEPHPDPVAEGHRRFMMLHNHEGWLAWQLTRPLDPSKDWGRG